MKSADLLERSYPGRRAELKRSILAKALQCFNAYGIEATTIEMIRAECDTSVGAIYHHFGNKEGLVAALFFAALEDQTALLNEYLEKAETGAQGVHALVYSYVDWVDNQPDWARFQYHASHAVTKGPFGEELAIRNRTRNQRVLEWLAEPGRKEVIAPLPPELVPALIIGPAESYCRAWLAGRVQQRPAMYREVFAEAAWRSLCVGGQAEKSSEKK